MKSLRVLVAVFVMCIWSSTVFGVTEVSTTVTSAQITQYRAHSVEHPNYGARNMHMFSVIGLSNGCNTVYFYADQDSFLYSTTLAAILKRETVSLSYDVDSRGPWGDASSCKLTSISILH